MLFSYPSSLKLLSRINLDPLELEPLKPSALLETQVDKGSFLLGAGFHAKDIFLENLIRGV